MITAPAERKLFLIDAFAVIFRAYYAFIKNPRINSKGVNTSAVFGFTNALLDVLGQERPSHLAVVFDAPGDTFRNVQFPAYKANRDETPEDIKRSIPLIIDLLKAFDIPMISLVGYEADDLIGFIAQHAAAEDFDVYMMTPDKDFGQLVTDRIRIFRPGRNGDGAEVWGPEEVCARFEVKEPRQVIDLLGLMGDSVDNIPGIPGVGPKTATKWLAEFGSLEAVLEQAHTLPGKMREKVEANRELALLSKSLATICLDIPFDVDLEAMRMGHPDVTLLNQQLELLEFRTVGKRVAEIFRGAEGLGAGSRVDRASGAAADSPTAQKSPPPATGQLDLFGSPVENGTAPGAGESDVTWDRGYKKLADVPHAYAMVQDWEALRQMLSVLEQATAFAFDTETTGLDARNAEWVGCSFATEPGKAWWIPVQGGPWSREELREALRPVLTDPGKTCVGHNLKFDLQVMRAQGLKIGNTLWDSMVAHYLLQPETAHGMDRLAEVELGYETIPIEALIGKKGKTQRSLGDLPPESITDYACEDADITWQLAEKFSPQLETVGAADLARDVEMPLVQVLADMEWAGVRLDTEALEAYSAALETDLIALQSSIHALAGTAFNVDSPKQLGDVLFEHLKIPAKLKKTATGQYPTGEEVLAKLSNLHPIIAEILRYRRLKKLRSTYLEPLPKLVDAHTGRLHTHYAQTVAATGRLSSSHPNLQNIPIRTEEGRAIRKAFVPRDDQHVLIAADYSQIELRVAASMSQDPGLVEAFLSGHDIHLATAARVFQVPLSAVDREMRSKAKAVNFGILYGQGAFGLAENLGISRTEAKEIIDAYFAQFTGLRDFTAQCVARARETGYAETLLGRRRYLPDISSASANVRAFAERNAVNAPIQGSAADIIKVAMVRIPPALRSAGLSTTMTMQVHDELVFDAPQHEAEAASRIIRDVMENAVKLAVPLVVDLQVGRDWLEAH
jgi:DNA polymerase-1